MSTGGNSKPRTRNDNKMDTKEVLASLQQEMELMRKELAEIKEHELFKDDTDSAVLARVKRLEERMNSFEAETRQMRTELKNNNSRYKALLDKCVSMESQSRRNNLVFDGVPESQGENCTS